MFLSNSSLEVKIKKKKKVKEKDFGVRTVHGPGRAERLEIQSLSSLRKRNSNIHLDLYLVINP